MVEKGEMIEESKLIAIVGKDYIDTDEAILTSYSRDLSFVPSIKPACVVKPDTADQVLKIVGLAKETQTALVRSVPVLRISEVTPYPVLGALS